MKADHTEAGAKLLVQRIGELDAEVRKLRDERDRWRTVAEGLARQVEELDRFCPYEGVARLEAFEQAKRDFDDPHLPFFTSAKINPESKP